MRVVCTGSRSWRDRATILLALLAIPPDAEIIVGGARGADKLVEELAGGLGHDLIVLPANWEKHGKAAGIIRNLEMLDLNPEVVLAFWDGESRGTKHTIDAARSRGIEVRVYEPENSP